MAKMISTGRLVAWDPVAQKEVWHADLPDPKSGGTLSTAGNLVFQGRADGHLVAYRATDGKQIWEFDTGIGIAAPPMTYEVNGTQYIAVEAGWGGPMVLNNRPVGKGKVGPGLLLSFALGGSAPLIRFDRKILPVPMPTFRVAATTPEIEKGRVLFAMYCGRCHGGNVVSGGSVPDLRYAEEPRTRCSRKSCGEARAGSSACRHSRGTSRQSKFDSSTHTFSTALVSQPEQMPHTSSPRGTLCIPKWHDWS